MKAELMKQNKEEANYQITAKMKHKESKVDTIPEKKHNNNQSA